MIVLNIFRFQVVQIRSYGIEKSEKGEIQVRKYKQVWWKE